MWKGEKRPGVPGGNFLEGAEEASAIESAVFVTYVRFWQ
jgi:hypothetical protein